MARPRTREYTEEEIFPTPPTRLMKYDKLRLLIEREDENGRKIPFDILYCTKEGKVIANKGCICTGVDTRHRRHTYRMGGSGLPRTFRDVLVMRVNEYKIVCS